MTVTDRPAVEQERIVALDVLRGVAIGGILLANVFVFFGHLFDPNGRLDLLPTARIDRWIEFLEHVIVEGKFYSIFSLLFGIGFGLELSRRGDLAIGRFRRRLAALVGIGFVHAFLLWAGDILLLYALLGFGMPWFARRSDRSLLRWTIGLLATPGVLYLIARIVGQFAPVGRMALTNYLTHSIVCVTLSYGFGFGLWGHIGALQAWGIALVVVLLQIPLSRSWLSGHRYGPMEWVWRRLTYGRPLLMRGSS